MSGGGNIKVVVRCRPLNTRELSRGAKGLIEMNGNQTILHKPDSSDPGNAKATKKEDMAFTFDKSYWSADKNSSNYADQKTLYNDLGVELLDHSFEGYNTCIFAYGQTGSGKSYSMMGYGEDKGIIPLTCCALFERISNNNDPNITYKVQVSYIEIYNERVRDLLNPKNKGNLKVREHPVLGPYVEDLSKLLVNSFDDIENLMDEGNKARTVAATNMNATSSRSHAVFTLLLTQKRQDAETKMETEKVSRISLVDLAGSERANSTGATGDRLKEGANINKSLTTLGKVIAALADQSSGKGSKKKEHFVPYRDSVLTWLLKDSLGGNSKTAMIAAISPADYDETLSTLRYADQAKRIKNKAIVNEDPNAKLIRELKEELSRLRNELGISPGDMTYSRGAGGDSEEIVILKDKDGNTIKKSKGELIDQLQASEKLMSEVNESWEEKLRRTQEIQHEREKALEELGIMVEKNAVGVHPPKKVPHLVNLNEDPLMSECLVYQLKSGITRVGRLDDEVPAEIRLSGENILPEHCYFDNKDGAVTLFPTNDSLTMVNGIRTSKPKKLRSGFRVILGDFHVFRYNNPEEVRRERAKTKLSISITTKEHYNSGEDTPARADSPTSTASLMSEAVIDWNYAKKEAALNYVTLGPEVVNLPDEDLQRLADDIKKIQSGRRGDSVEDDNGSSEVVKEMQQQLEILKQEHEDKMRILTASNLEADELKAEKKQMEEKLKMLEAEMQTTLEVQAQEYKEKMAKLTAASSDPRHLSESRPYTDEELRLIHKTLKKWKHQRHVQMAEEILSNAVVLKEANVISRELKKEIQYQLTIIEDEPYTNPVSFYESTSALHQYNTSEDTSLHLSKKPCIGVKVIDFKNGVVYVWSLDKLKARMQKMRNLYNYIDRPQYSKHFNWEDPFYENPCPQFTFIGSASMALRCLILKSEYEQRVPVICRYSGKAMAQCLVRVKFISDSKQSKDPSENTVFEVRIEELTGIDEEQYTQVHVQFKLSSFGAVPPLSSGEHIYATDLKSDFGTGPIRFGYAQTLSVALTPAIVEVLTNGMLAFEIYGKAEPCVLQQIEKWDEIQSSTGDDQPERVIPRERRSEEELVAEEKHDIVAWVQVCEMSPNGDYVPVQVLSQNSLDPGAFFLRQGLQRRIVLTLTHNSGRQFPWTRVSKMEIGQVRLLDGKGRLAESPAQNDVQMKIVPPQKIEFNIDGTSTLVAQCSWDSTLHGSLFLNRTTQSNSRVLLRLTWYVEAEKCVEPICFNMDIAVQVQGREARPPSRLVQLLNSSKVLWKTSGLFSITLKPPMTRKISELWRLNTANKYVRGEELLGNWKPRGVSLVKDYKRISESIRKREAVEFMKQVYNLDETRIVVAGASSKMNTPVRDEKELYKKVLDLWKKKWGTTKEIVINQDPPLSGSYPDAETYKHTKDTKLVAQVRMVGKTDQITKRGYLYTPENADDYWVKRWYVLRRPYLFIYESQKETEELGAINLSSVRVDYMKEREDMLKRQYVFSIYTNNNAYMLQASSKQEMIDWISKIDQFYQNANLD